MGLLVASLLVVFCALYLVINSSKNDTETQNIETPLEPDGQKTGDINTSQIQKIMLKQLENLETIKKILIFFFIAIQYGTI